MKPRFFTKTFRHFFIGFLCIIGLAFAVMIGVASWTPNPPQPPAVDNFATPR